MNLINLNYLKIVLSDKLLLLTMENGNAHKIGIRKELRKFRKKYESFSVKAMYLIRNTKKNKRRLKKSNSKSKRRLKNSKRRMKKC